MSPDDYPFDDTSVYHTTYSGIYLYPWMRCSEPDAESGYHSDTEHHRSASAGFHVAMKRVPTPSAFTSRVKTCSRHSPSWTSPE